MEINGVAHTFITAGDFAAARAFYGRLFTVLGLTVAECKLLSSTAHEQFLRRFDEEVIRLIHIAALHPACRLVMAPPIARSPVEIMQNSNAVGAPLLR